LAATRGEKEIHRRKSSGYFVGVFGFFSLPADFRGVVVFFGEFSFMDLLDWDPDDFFKLDFFSSFVLLCFLAGSFPPALSLLGELTFFGGVFSPSFFSALEGDLVGVLTSLKLTFGLAAIDFAARRPGKEIQYMTRPFLF
jgi:hypothetical protein